MTDRERADAVYTALLDRAGERWVQPRIERTQRVLDLLDNPQRTYRVVHITGTNGKTSTARMIEALVQSVPAIIEFGKKHSTLDPDCDMLAAVLGQKA